MNPVLTPEAATKGHDRLGFTTALALALHAVIILGLTFSFEPSAKTPARSTLEITLAQFKGEKKPATADYLAEHNQEGSGTDTEKRKLTSTESTDLTAPLTQHVSKLAASSQAEADPRRPLVTTRASSTQQSLEAPITNTSQELPSPLPHDQQYHPAGEIASLEAELDRIRQNYARMPRVQRQTSVATQASVSARYIYDWEQRIEFVGNAYYPEEARQRHIFGNLRLLVVILPNGALKEVKILESSGEEILDKAALSIVRKAAPFPPFTTAMKKQMDMLEIIRTWQFQKDFNTSSD